MSRSAKTRLEHSISKSPVNHLLTHIPVNTLHSSIPLIHLINIIFKKLQTLFSIDCIALLIYDDQVTSIQEALVSKYNSNSEDTTFNFITQPSKLTAVQKLIAELSFPVVKSLDEWMQEENTTYCLVNNEAHYKHHCYIPLDVNNLVLGTLELHNEDKELSRECLTFCSTIADLLSEIIFQQRTHTATQPGHSLINNNTYAERLTTNVDLHSAAKNDLLSRLEAQIKAINNVDSFEEFFIKTAEVFPVAYSQIKTRLDEIAAYKKQLEYESLHIPEDHTPANKYPEIIGAGSGMSNVFALMNQVADSESTVLISGETGTGKELIARALHEHSLRKNRIMIKVNCAAIPENLIESELFGHEKGAFTGAMDRRTGKFELADNSTLFLDEIGELPLDLQAKLLRVLQEKEIERVGGKATIKTDVRIIAATNRNLTADVERGLFRQDLYYRLNVFPIHLPALRERPEDIPLLASHFLAAYARKAGKQISGFSRGVMREMCNYQWPGNIRELEHLIERQVLLNTKPIINQIDIPLREKTINNKDGVPHKIKTIDENERDHILTVLQLCKGRISGPDGAAKLLGVPATTLNSKIKRLGLSKKHF